MTLPSERASGDGGRRVPDPVTTDPRASQDPFPPEVNDDMVHAVVDLAAEMDARRTWRERAADIVHSVRLLLAIIWYNIVRSHRR